MSAMILPALFALLCAFPPVIRGKRAVHSIVGIVRPQGPLNPDGSTTVFAHVQERGEFRLCKLAGIAAGVPFIWMGGPLVLLFQAIAMVLADQLARSSGAIDYAGHNAEIMAAERAGVIGYREAEIARMADDRDKQGQDIGAMLDRWRWLGRAVFALGRV